MCAFHASAGSVEEHSRIEPIGQQPCAGGLHPLDLARIHGGAGYLYRLGERSAAEALAELAQGPDGPDRVLGLLAEFGRLTPARLTAAGGERPLPRHLAVVP